MDGYHEALQQDFEDLYLEIAATLGGGDNVPPKIREMISSIYNSIVRYEEDLKASVADDRIPDA